MKRAEKRSHAAYYIKPLNITLDVAAVAVTGLAVFSGLAVNMLHLMAYLAASWLITGYFSRYYEVYRYTGAMRFAGKIVKQAVFFGLCAAGFFVFVKRAVFNTEALCTYISITMACCIFFKIVAYRLIKTVPVRGAGNYIVIGTEHDVKNLLTVIQSGNFSGMFSSGNGAKYVGEALHYASNNSVDTMYCALAQVTTTQVHKLTAFAGRSGIALKFIPDGHDIYPRALQVDYYEGFPVLAAQNTPLDNPPARIGKRIFDIIFSSLVLVFVFSWLIPIVAFFIKIESKGPVFFKQIRVGHNGTEFWCYKFRSMQVNNSEGKVTVKNDPRITKAGKFLRKTSLDEMPQFINVLLGHMSVSGPRPKIWGHHNQYKDHIHKFMDRLNVKPGITGLAQVSGYRGDINSDAEMQNRIRYDVFYIENWSMLLDIKIIIQTVVNIFMGEEKAF